MASINVTFTFDTIEKAQLALTYFEHYKEFVDGKILPDTDELYETSSHFRKLCAEYKEARLKRDEFINRHNHST